MENTLLNTIIEERVTEMPTEKQLKTHTKWIAKHSQTPIINTIWGTYLNEYCHVREAYHQPYLQSLNK